MTVFQVLDLLEINFYILMLPCICYNIEQYSEKKLVFQIFLMNKLNTIISVLF